MREVLNFINQKWQKGVETRPVISPFLGEAVALTHLASAEQLEEALEAAKTALKTYKNTSAFVRAKLLNEIATGLETNRTELVQSIIDEAGKPRLFAEAEVSRAVTTFKTAAEECKRFAGEVIRLDLDAQTRDFAPATALWVPKGVVLAISPFNFPLNLAAHKVAPALACGAVVILKPPPQAPTAAMILAQVFEKAALACSDAVEKIPLAALQVLQASNDVMSRALTDPRIQILSFTGSDQVGFKLQGLAIKKKVCLELGGNASVIIDESADLKRAAQRCALGAFAYAGQVCISVQRIFVHKSVRNEFTKLLIAASESLVVGDPNDSKTIVGPMIDTANTERVLSWVDEAIKKGAEALFGGGQKVSKNILKPILLQNVTVDCRLSRDEVFGPVAILEEFDFFEDSVSKVNASRFGLQASVFTQNLKNMDYANHELEVGGVIINENSMFRLDHMPYGGVKDSGLGREGLKYAMEEFSERKILIRYSAKT